MTSTGGSIVFVTVLLYLAIAAYSAGDVENPSPSDSKQRQANAAELDLGLQGRKWCMPKEDTSDKILQENIEFVCNNGIDCKPIQPGGPCYYPKNAWSHAQYAMNAYYSAKGRNSVDCDFNQTGFLSDSDLSM
ncbi:glucan endo-1,3-beta-glucosidase-like [Melia azedarach]|uniref:Glucan endo-1,3-beta-glucosidase-like n=1 Tax=Melia azedarach TaxID=155640 RepID=A0ACC1Y9D2_MELAZ|nr:glucan endo-1,3-beta-glucosidase-like [Melia azedarach]